MSNLTANEILNQEGFYNNLGLHLAANNQIRELALDAMEYYYSFGGVPDDILETIAQNNDLGLQLYAGWIKLPIIAAMEAYNNQSSGELLFTLEIVGADLRVTNKNEFTVDSTDCKMNDPNFGFSVFDFSKNNWQSEITEGFTQQSPQPQSGIYNIGFTAIVSGIEYAFDDANFLLSSTTSSRIITLTLVNK